MRSTEKHKTVTFVKAVLPSVKITPLQENIDKKISIEQHNPGKLLQSQKDSAATITMKQIINYVKIV